MVSGLMYKYLIYLSWLHAWCKSCPASFFYTWWSSFPSTSLYWRDFPFLIVYSLLCVLFDHKCVFILISPFCPTNQCVCFYTNTIVFWKLYSLVIPYDQETWCLQLFFFFLFKAWFAIWGSWFQTNFRILCSISVKNATGIFIGTVLNL